MDILPPKVMESLTPMMKQYYEIKKQSMDSILFFRMGDFYEVFGTDAEQIAPLLDIVLTSRERGDQQKIKFCGVPHHSCQSYWIKLLRLGFRVTVADQLEDAKHSKGLVKRGIVRVLTPGCIDELEGLSRDKPNYLMGLYEDPRTKTWAVLFADISTGELRLGSVSSLDQVYELIRVYEPREILCRRFFQKDWQEKLHEHFEDQKILTGCLPEDILRDKNQQESMILKVLGADFDKEAFLKKVPGGAEVLCALWRHLEVMKISLSIFLNVKGLIDPTEISLHDVAVRDLEIFETARGRQTKGSLFYQINRSATPMGARLLRYSLGRPLQDVETIKSRQKVVEELLGLEVLYQQRIRKQLQGVGDIERLTARLRGSKITPLEMGRLAATTEHLEALGGLLESLLQDDSKELGEFSRVFQGAKKFNRVFHKVFSSSSPSPSSLPPESRGSKEVAYLLFQPGYNRSLDELRELADNGQKKVEAYQQALRERTKIPTLKIKTHKTYGLLIEVTKTHLAKVPPDFIRRQTMVNNERFVTEELRELDESLGVAREKAEAEEGRLFAELVQTLSAYQKELLFVAGRVALFDMLTSFAVLAQEKNYCRPVVSKGAKELSLVAARHPVIEEFVGHHQFIPNDIYLTESAKQFLITGPNMAGKSTIMRQVALCSLLAQIGSFVPAKEASLPLFDNIFTRVGASDDLSQGLSTFMVEMKEAAMILREATSESLVILDEVGRGTSTEDGRALAAAILEQISEKCRSWAFFATHYHELVTMGEHLKTVQPMQTLVEEKDGQMSFSHKLVKGACGSSYGIEVARLAGIPDHVIGAAEKHLQSMGTPPVPQKEPQVTPVSSEGTAVFTHDYLREVDFKLKTLRINRVTPLQALNLLNEFVEMSSFQSTTKSFPDRQTLF